MSTVVDISPKLPRKRNAVEARSRLLAAAQQFFSTNGYAATGVRELAAGAGLDAALVSRYFGSKEGLFRAALIESLDIEHMLDTPRERFGVHVVAYFLDRDRGAPNPLRMMLLAATDPGARAIALTTLEERVIRPLAAWIGGADGMERAARISMLCSGFFTYWKLLPLDVFAAGVDVGTRRWLEQALQGALEGSV